MTDQSHSNLQFNTTANKLTAVRIFFVPFVVLALDQQTPFYDFIAVLCFGLAGLTDYLDGYYARSHQAITVIGKLMDPLADKFLVVSTLVMLLHLDRLHPYVVILLVCRELAITGLRALASNEGIIIAASKLAKWKTVTQMIAIPLLMLTDPFWNLPLRLIGNVFIWISVFVSIWSAQDYIVDFFKALRARSKIKKTIRRTERIRKILKKNPDLAQAIKEELKNQA